MRGMDLSYRPSGVVVLGIFMIIFAVLNIFWTIMYIPLLSVGSFSLFSLFSTSVGLVSFGFMLATSVLLVVGAAGLLSMTRWGYHTGLVASILLIVSVCVSLFVGGLFFILSIGGLILGIITLAYLLTDVKYEYQIDSSSGYPVRYEYPERRSTVRASKIVSVPEPPPVAIKPKPEECLYCGTEIPENAEYCPHCGEARVRCFVCNQYIVSGDRYVKCPYCGILNHVNHLPKGRKERGYCPNCKQKLKEENLV
jgi:hypothetical protein